MKLIHKTGCIVNSVEIDDEDVDYIKNDVLKEKLEFIINNIPQKYQYKSDILVGVITNIITGCNKTETKEIQYGSKPDEELYISILDTKNFRIRNFYDGATQEEWLTINDHFVDHDYLQYQFNTLKQVLVEVVNEFYENSSVTDDPNDYRYNVKCILSTIGYSFGKLTHIGDRCECCGDTIDTYELVV